jgi:hypothetical protein
MTVRADRIAPSAIALGVLARADLCTFNWNTRDGWPMGATVAPQWLDGKLWFSMDKAEARVHAIRRDPRVAVVLSAPGQSVTIKGRCEFSDDLEVKRRVYRATAETVARLSEGGPEPDAYARYLEGKGSVVFEVIPEKWIAFDGRDGTVTTSPPALARSGG